MTARPRTLRYGQAVRDRIALIARHGSDLLAVALAVASIAEVLFADLPASKATLLPAAVLWSFPLLVRRRYPLAAPLVVFGTLVALAVVEPTVVADTTSTFACVLFAFWALGVNNPPARSVPGWLAGVASIAFVVARDETTSPFADFLFVSAMCTLAFIAGAALYRRVVHARELYERARRAEREREERAREAVREERARLARELHDVVAHSISVMTVQAAGVGRLLRPEQEREREALRAVEQTGREALAEMRRLLGVLRRDEVDAELTPQPGISNVERLLEQVRAAGLPVELRVEGEPRPLPPGVDLSAYRIVQEALTNALKHAGPARATVAVRYREDAVEVDVTDNGRLDGLDGGGDGQGLIGMRERVAVYGGVLEAGPRGDGGFGVRARLPIAGAAS
jgi:signal transduction histidine kinase